MAARHVPALPEESAIDLNAAIAATEEEVMRDAMGEDPLENDGDDSLEQMGEGLEGDELDEGEDDEGLEAQEEGEGDQPQRGQRARQPAERDARQGRRPLFVGEQPEGEEGAEEGEGEASEGDEIEEGEEAEGQEEGEPRGRVPAFRLREETERRRQSDERAERLEAELRARDERIDQILATMAANRQGGQQQQQEQQDPEPDLFADPDGWKAWNRRQAQQEARQAAREMVSQGLQETTLTRVNTSLQEAATGDRAWEFQPAYQALISQNTRDPVAQATVRRIFNAPDPAVALFDWWDQNGGAEFRENVYAQLSENFAPPQRQQGQQRSRGRGELVARSHTDNGERGGRPRVAFEGARSVRTGPPSLSAAGRAGSPVEDPDLMDPSEGSILRYALK